MRGSCQVGDNKGPSQAPPSWAVSSGEETPAVISEKEFCPGMDDATGSQATAWNPGLTLRVKESRSVKTPE